MDIKQEIRGKIAELARRLGNDASSLADDELIPMTGYLDSAALFELIAWYEEKFRLKIPQEELNIDNFGTLNAMAEYAAKRS
jgi:acyl carrier protein